MKISTLRLWRLMAGLSVEEVGEKLGCHSETVRRYERSVYPIPGQVAQRLAIIYGVKTDQIIDAATANAKKGKQ